MLHAIVAVVLAAVYPQVGVPDGGIIITEIEPSHPYIEYISQYPWPVSEALEIVDCESGFDPTAVSPTNDHGLFQHNGRYGPERFEKAGYSWSQRYDPAVNTAVAYWLWDQTDDWRHWTCRYAVTGTEEWNPSGVDLLSNRTTGDLRD